MFLISEHPNQGGSRSQMYMTELFIHIWFSKWSFLRSPYWTDSQYNECLPWGGTEIDWFFPTSKNEFILKCSIFCLRKWGCVCVCMYVCVWIWLSWSCFLRGLINTDRFFTSGIYVAVSSQSTSVALNAQSHFLLGQDSCFLIYSYCTSGIFLWNRCWQCGSGMETFLRLLQPNWLAACCWLSSVFSAFLKHPPHIPLFFAVLST